MGLFSKAPKFTVTLEVSAKDELDAQKKIKAIQLIANNIDTDNLEMFGNISTKLGVNIKIRSHKENLLNL